MQFFLFLNLFMLFFKKVFVGNVEIMHKMFKFCSRCSSPGAAPPQALKPVVGGGFSH